MKNISYPEARKIVENSLVTTTYWNIAKPTNNPIQNKGMTLSEIITLIEELKSTNRIAERKLNQPANQTSPLNQSKKEPLTPD